jgi:hypothetical protein
VLRGQPELRAQLVLSVWLDRRAPAVYKEFLGWPVPPGQLGSRGRKDCRGFKDRSG